MRSGAPARALQSFAARLAGLGRAQRWTALAGGVSCDVWKVEAPGRTVVVKRPLAQLRVAADWRAPPERARTEFAWLKLAREIVPGGAPEPLALDSEIGVLAVEWLAPDRYPLWKARLLAGEVEPGHAAAVGERLGRLHAATARRPELATAFATDEAFFALRLDAYLLEAGRRNPAVADQIEALVETTAATRLALVHGDVSPKNILLGPGGPVFLDAETAWWGDPAFDLAFCLNHLLLKQIVVPAARAELAESFASFCAAYMAGVDWESPEALEARAGALLPGLMLARVDGKSPVEYLPDEGSRAPVRAIALALLAEAPPGLAAVLRHFEGLLAKA